MRIPSRCLRDTACLAALLCVAGAAQAGIPPDTTQAGFPGAVSAPGAGHVVPAVPAPATYGMLLAGMALPGTVARRRRG